MKNGTVTLLAFVLASCSVADPFLAPLSEPTSVKLNHSQMVLTKGFSTTFFPSVEPTSAINSRVVLTVSDPTILGVQGNRVTGLMAGTAVLSGVSVAGQTKALCSITVGGWPRLSLAGQVSHLAGNNESLDLRDGVGSAARFFEPSGVCVLGNSLYVADKRHQVLRVVRIDTGAVSTLVTTGVNFWGPSAIVTDGASLYVADEWQNSIQRVDPASGVVTKLATLPNANPRGLCVHGGFLYVVGSGQNVIYAVDITSGATSVFAGTPGLRGTADGLGTSVRFDNPTGITSDGTFLYVADSGNHVIRRIQLSTALVTTWAGIPGDSGDRDGSSAAARFNYPQGLAFAGNQLYVTDGWGSRIRQYDGSSATWSTPAGDNWKGSADGIGSVARFLGALGLATAGGTLYVADASANTIRRMNTSTHEVRTLAGKSPVGRADGVGSAASFAEPSTIVTDGESLFVFDVFNAVLRRVTVSGVVTTLAGQLGDHEVTDGRGGQARFQAVQAACSDGVSLYLLDNWGSTVRRVVASSGVVTTLFPTPGNSARAVCTDGVWLYLVTWSGELLKVNIDSGSSTTLATGFQDVQGICYDGTKLYVTESGLNRIRTVDRSGQVNPFLDSGLNYPRNLITDGSSLLVLNNWGSEIVRVDLASRAVTTVVGTPTRGNADGPATSASFQNLVGLCTLDGVLYAVDDQNHNVRVIH